MSSRRRVEVGNALMHVALAGVPADGKRTSRRPVVRTALAVIGVTGALIQQSASTRLALLFLTGTALGIGQRPWLGLDRLRDARQPGRVVASALLRPACAQPADEMLTGRPAMSLLRQAVT